MAVICGYNVGNFNGAGIAITVRAGDPNPGQSLTVVADKHGLCGTVFAIL